MEENRKGPGIFYAVTGVATLVVAIIGATFAYFTATAEFTDDSEDITGTAATTSLTVEVKKVSTDATGDLVPQKAVAIQSAVTGTDSKSCVDGNGNTVCQVYSVTIHNGGTSAVDVTADIAFTGDYENLKWGLGTTATTGFGTVEDAIIDGAATDMTGAEHVVIGAGTDQIYYVVVFIDEIGNPQNTLDKGTFTGSVTVNTVGGEGSGLTSTFTA